MQPALRAALVMAVTAITAMPAAAQSRSRSDGVHVSLHGSGTTVQIPKEDRESGLGYGGMIGYGVSRLLLHAGADVARLDAPYVDEVTVLHADVGLRFHFRSARAALIPYAGIAWTRRIAKRDDIMLFGTSNDLQVSGSGLTVGGGALYYVRPSLAVHADLKVTAGEMNDLRINGEKLQGCVLIVCEGNTFFEGSARLALGLSWFPGGLW